MSDYHPRELVLRRRVKALETGLIKLKKRQKKERKKADQTLAQMKAEYLEYIQTERGRLEWSVANLPNKQRREIMAEWDNG